MSTYAVDRRPAAVAHATGPIATDLYRIGFGDPADNATIVRDATASIAAEARYQGGPLALVSGPASLPVAFVLAHRLVHQYAAVAIFDPKMCGYVVAVVHGAALVAVGDVIPAADVHEPHVCGVGLPQAACAETGCEACSQNILWGFVPRIGAEPWGLRL